MSPFQRLALCALLIVVGVGCPPEDPTGYALFESPVVNPLAITADGTRLVVVNPTAGSVSVVNLNLNPGVEMRENWLSRMAIVSMGPDSQ